MDAFYFGPEKQPLLGFHHPPTGVSIRESAIVICHPIGHEFIKSYSAIRTLAQHLAARGNHVFRFDYSGTGDSSGPSDEISVSQWISDIEQACVEIREITGIDRLCLIGVRFGALLAYAASGSPDICKLVMVNPVLDGSDYLGRLTAMHEKMLVDEDRFYFNSSSIKATEDELLGHPFPLSLRNEMKALSAVSIGAQVLDSVDLFYSQIPVDNDLQTIQQGAKTTVKLHETGETVDWEDVAAIEDQIIIGKTVREIAALSF